MQYLAYRHARVCEAGFDRSELRPRRPSSSRLRRWLAERLDVAADRRQPGPRVQRSRFISNLRSASLIRSPRRRLASLGGSVAPLRAHSFPHPATRAARSFRSPRSPPEPVEGVEGSPLPVVDPIRISGPLASRTQLKRGREVRTKSASLHPSLATTASHS
jgi:hypothetical protein